VPTLEIIPLREYDFPATTEVVVERALEVTEYQSMVVFVRCHATSLGGGSSTLAVRLMAYSPSEEDPQMDFVGGELAEALLDNSALQGTLVKAYVTPPTKVSHVQVRVRGVKGTSACKATISAGLWVNGCAAEDPDP
jgi:hypothetical protein